LFKDLAFAVTASSALAPDYQSGAEVRQRKCPPRECQASTTQKRNFALRNDDIQ